MERKVLAVMAIAAVAFGLYRIDCMGESGDAQRTIARVDKAPIECLLHTAECVTPAERETHGNGAEQSTGIKSDNSQRATARVKPRGTYSISEKGKSFIRRYEKCELKSYPDLGGGYTVGYGHHGPDVKAGMRITVREAENYFAKDLMEAEAYSEWLLKSLPYDYGFSQSFFDGLCDLVFNCGVGAVRGSAFYSRLSKCRVSGGVMNESDFAYALSAVKTLNAPHKGHKMRRNECHGMMSI